MVVCWFAAGWVVGDDACEGSVASVLGTARTGCTGASVHAHLCIKVYMHTHTYILIYVQPCTTHQTFSNMSGRIRSSPDRTAPKACEAMPSILTNHWEDTCIIF